MARRTKLSKTDRVALRTLAAERLLIEAIPEIHERQILCTTLGRAQFAAEIAAAYPDARVCCHFLDIFLADESRAMHGAGGGNLSMVCAADFPDAEFDLVAIPVSTAGDAELTRDLLQAGHQALPQGGRMLASTWNRDDQWLHGEMRKLFPKVTRRATDRGVLYLATKTAPLKKVKVFTSEFAFRDHGRLIKAVSRPGVFSHRSIDAGARALLNTMVVEDGFHVLDIGCGSGVVGLAAAFRAEGVTVVGVDSNARAVQCTQQGAVLNALTNVTTCLNADGDCGEAGTFDLVLGNPPYFSDFRIAEIFLQAACRALKPRGRVLMVSMNSTWYEQRFGELFDDVRMHAHKAYVVAEGRQRAAVR